MKIIGGLGLVLAVIFAALLLTPLFDLQDEGVAIPSLDAPALGFFNNVGNLAVIMVGLIGIAFLFAAVVYAFKR
jgi:hypothetical protein